MELSPIIQALLFANPNPLSVEEIWEVFEQDGQNPHTLEEISGVLEALRQEFSEKKIGFELTETHRGFTFCTKKEYFPFVAKYLEKNQTRKLSKSALETLSIIVFQPHCTKLDIENVRGVSADYAIERLIDKELIEISGTKDTAGHPLTYHTTPKFLDYFGLKSLDEFYQLQQSVSQSSVPNLLPKNEENPTEIPQNSEEKPSENPTESIEESIV